MNRDNGPYDPVAGRARIQAAEQRKSDRVEKAKRSNRRRNRLAAASRRKGKK